MERRVVAAVLVVSLALATVPSGGLGQSGDASVAPGERFAGVVGVQGAEVEGEVDARALEERFAGAESDGARAAVVAETMAEGRDRLDELERRRDRLRAARANGTISEGEYRARTARLAAESRSLQRRLDRTADASREVPDAALRERGVDRAELDRLRRAAGNLTGPEVAAIARGIAGGDRGQPAAFPPGRATGAANGSEPPERATNGSDRGPPDERAGGSSDSRSDGNASDRSGAGDGASGNASDAEDGASGESGERGKSGERTGGDTDESERGEAEDGAGSQR